AKLLQFFLGNKKDEIRQKIVEGVIPLIAENALHSIVELYQNGQLTGAHYNHFKGRFQKLKIYPLQDEPLPPIAPRKPSKNIFINSDKSLSLADAFSLEN